MTKYELKPLEQWYCDFCHEIIKDVSEGYVEWIVVERESEGSSLVTVRSVVKDITGELKSIFNDRELDSDEFGEYLSSLEALSHGDEDLSLEDLWGAGNTVPSKYINKEFKIVHHATHSPRQPYNDCYFHKNKDGWLADTLENFAGHDGLPMLFMFIDEGPYYGGTKNQSYYDGPSLQIQDLRDWVEFTKRLTIPFYEEARKFILSAKTDGVLEGFSESAIYSQRVLRSILYGYGDERESEDSPQAFNDFLLNRIDRPELELVESPSVDSVRCSNPSPILFQSPDTEPEREEPVSFSELLIQGRVGEAVVEIALSSFDYDVGPYGAERTMGTRLMRDLREGGANQSPTALALRRQPDFIVQNRKEPSDVSWVEVKSTVMPLSNWRYDGNRILQCQKVYPDSIWVVCSLPDLELYAIKINDLNVESLPVLRYGKKGIDVPQIFQPIHTMFSNIDENELSTLTKKLKLRLTELFH